MISVPLEKHCAAAVLRTDSKGTKKRAGRPVGKPPGRDERRRRSERGGDAGEMGLDSGRSCRSSRSDVLRHWTRGARENREWLRDLGPERREEVRSH